MAEQGHLQVSGNQDDLIEVVELTKKFGDVNAVNGISFGLRRGEFFGFLGPNGAGKTTTINMLTGLSRPDSGTIRIAGQDCTRNPKAAQHLIGIVPDESNLYPELSGFDNLCFCAALYGMRKREREQRSMELLETFGLKDAASRNFGGYSKGMKRKLTIAAGIIHNPLILFLDEPTTGIDVAGARQIRQLIAGLHKSGTTIFLTTHYIEEAERLCQRIAFIVKGRIVRSDSVKNLLQPLAGKQIMQLSVSGDADYLARILAAAIPEYGFQAVSPQQIRIESVESISLSRLVRCLDAQRAEISEARRLMPTLEEIFVTVTGIEADMMKKEAEKKAGPA